MKYNKTILGILILTSLVYAVDFQPVIVSNNESWSNATIKFIDEDDNVIAVESFTSATTQTSNVYYITNMSAPYYYDGYYNVSVALDGVWQDEDNRTPTYLGRSNTVKGNWSINGNLTVDDHSYLKSQAFIGGVEKTQSTGDLETNLLAHWLLNDDAADTDVADTTGNYDGTLNGGDNTEDKSVSGKINQAFTFNGADDDVSVASLDEITPSNVKTFAVWIYPTGTGISGVVGRHTYNTGYYDNYGFGINYNDQVVYGLASNNNAEWHENLYGSVDLDTWSHIVFTIEDDGADKEGNLYINGDLVATHTGTASYYNYDFYIGRGGRVDNTGLYFEGYIDDVRLYNRVLTEEDVKALYNVGGGTESESSAFVATASHHVISTSSSYHTSHSLNSLNDLAINGSLEVNTNFFADGDSSFGGDIETEGSITVGESGNIISDDGTSMNLIGRSGFIYLGSGSSRYIATQNSPSALYALVLARVAGDGIGLTTQGGIAVDTDTKGVLLGEDSDTLIYFDGDSLNIDNGGSWDFKSGTDNFLHDTTLTGTTGRNIFLGQYAGETDAWTQTDTSHASFNTGVGYGCLKNIKKAYQNTGVGYNTMYLMEEGYQNFAMGTNTFYSAKKGAFNVILGAQAGRYLGSSGGNAGNYNIAIGYDAVKGQSGTTTSVSNNIGIGRSTLKNIVSGSGGNTAVGYMAGEDVTTGAGNVFLGNQAGQDQVTTESNQLYIANTNTATPLIYGEFDNTYLEINGDANVTGYIQGQDYYSGDGSQGITDTTSYWLCTAADCSSSCQVSIKDGLITGCT